MIYRRIHVDGFGIWHDLVLDDLSPGLNVFVAPNEGGKSTLMSFLRAVLFGFKRRDDPQRYEPLRGGVHGGQIEIEADGARYTLVRSEDGSSAGSLEVKTADGGTQPPGALRRLLADTTETLYENVFAFGLDELQRLDTLQDEEVAGHIYSAGMATGGMSPIDFRQEVESGMRSLFLPRGRKQVVPRLLDDIEELQERIDELQQRPEEHADLVERRRDLERRLDELDEIIESKEVELARQRRAKRAWPHFQEMLAAEAGLQSLGVSPERALETLRTEIVRTERQLEEPEGGTASPSHSEPTDGTAPSSGTGSPSEADGAGGGDEGGSDIPDDALVGPEEGDGARPEGDAAEDETGEARETTSAGEEDEGGLHSVPAYRRDELLERRRAEAEAEPSAPEDGTEADPPESVRSETDDRQVESEAAGPTEEPGDDRRRSPEAAPVESTPAEWASEPSSERPGDDGSSEAVDIAALLPAEQRALFPHAGRIRSLHTGVSRLGELHAAVTRNRKEADQQALNLESFIKDLGEDWTLERLRRTSTEIALRESIRSQEESMRRKAAKVEALADRAEDAHETYESVVARPDPISRETVFLTWILVFGAGLATATLAPSWARIPTTISVIVVGTTAGALVTWLRSRGRQQQFRERSEIADREASLWKQHDEAQVELDRAVDRWEDWLRKHDLPASLTPEGTLDLLERVREAQEVDRQVEETRERAEQALAQLEKGCERIAALLEELDRPVPGDPTDPLSRLDPLVQELEALHLELQEAERERDRLRGVLDRFVQARAALRAIAGDEGLDDLRQRLESLDPDRLGQLIENAVEELDEARRERDATARKHGAVGEQIARAESDDELSVLLQEREARRAELVDAVRNWSAKALTVALFDAAKLRYEEERQPEVLEAASRYLVAMTGGRYGRVLAPLGENRLEVERERTGRRLRPEQLSRGTREQLYLSMRLALAGVYARESVALPLVADDILVNFDDERISAAARVLDEFASEGHQVLAFTCHQRIAQTFARHCPDARIRALPAQR